MVLIPPTTFWVFSAYFHFHLNLVTGAGAAVAAAAVAVLSDMVLVLECMNGGNMWQVTRCTVVGCGNREMSKAGNLKPKETI
jgi:hypothetical protein